MNSKFTRTMDRLGRIVLPLEQRKELGWDEQTNISITTDGNKIILQEEIPSCFMCKKTENLKIVNGKALCSTCLKKFTEV